MRRGSSRVIVNEDTLISRVAASPTLSGRVRFLRLEDISFAEQLAMISQVLTGCSNPKPAPAREQRRYFPPLLFRLLHHNV